ncbi:hypothetical protein BN14_00001 [Rhizoctonia solani AG-1 IB]|uniref:Uncharacterized protein n=1 Tax=Thanatephorus cucumeris (strain AG1-IB / isolate 7/3/14) TaxID=1108050 RepID=M5BQ89_THACB|nr:hypothetical protein BN14_00001 [Rhizoctonia solani AG-1 IB]
MMQHEGWELYSQKGIQSSLAFQHSINSQLYGNYVAAVIQQFTNLPPEEDTDSTGTPLPMTPVSLPSPPLVPEGLEPILPIKEEEKEEAEDVYIPLTNLINSFYPKEAYFPTLDASSPMPFTYPVPPLAEDASQDVPYCIQYKENIPPLQNILPNIPPVPAAWEPKKHHFKVQVACHDPFLFYHGS